MTETIMRRPFWILGAAFLCFSAVNAAGEDACDLVGESGISEKLITIDEDTPVGSVIGEIRTEGGPSEVTLDVQDNDVLGFNTTSREITLLKEVDKDNKTTVPALEIICTEINSTDTRGLTIIVVLDVKDVNDNAPVFNSIHHTVNVPENQPVGSTIYSNAIATDKDTSAWSNGLVVYSIVQDQNSSNRFDLGPAQRTPSIVLSQKLDYESVKQYTIRLVATDSPTKDSEKLSATATITINVQDSDDQKPEFSQRTYSGAISVDAAKRTTVRVSPPIRAWDPDSMKEPITYKIIDPYELFGVNNETAEVYTEELLYEGLQIVPVVIMAQQSINTDQERFALLTISISKANINAPRFSQRVYEVSRNELEAKGSILVVTTATDEDQQQGTGNLLTYAMVGTNTNFEVSESGVVRLMAALDYETKRQHVIKVTASDGTYTATATVQLNVQDVNDNNPRILNSDTEFVKERTQGQLVTIIDAEDDDVDDTLHYGLKSYSSLFTINAEGQLYITATADKLVQDDYALQVVVSDNGTPPRQTAVLITVIFPPTGYTTPKPTVPVAAATTAAEADDMLTMILGGVCGLLLILVVALIIYILWRNKRTKEQLDRARVPSVYGAKGLTYRQAEVPDDLPKIDLQYMDDTDTTSVFDGGTSVQENPLKSTVVNKGYMQSSGSEMDRDLNEIEVETAVVPYDDDDFGYPSAKPKYNGQLRTYHGDDTTSSGSNQSDSTGGSRRVLVNGGNKDGVGKMTSWDSDDKIHPQGAQKLVDSAATATSSSREKKTDKPELTVYF